MDNQQIIGDRQYSFGTIPPVEAIQVQVAIMRVIGEPLFKAFMETKGKQDDPEAAKKDQEAAGIAAISLLLAKLDADILTATMQTVFKYVTCDGKRVDMNATFVGRNKELWQVFIAALRFNFSDFLEGNLFASIRNVAKG